MDAAPGSAVQPAAATPATPPMTLAALPVDLQSAILSSVSESSRGFSHALVCREWAALAPEAQRSCLCVCSRAEGTTWNYIDVPPEGEQKRVVVEQSQLRQELSQYPSLTSLDINARELAPSFLSVLPESLRHLWVRGGWRRTRLFPEEQPVLQGLLRFPELQTLCVLSHALPDDPWPFSASLQVLDIGGVGNDGAMKRSEWGRASAQLERGGSDAPDAFMDRVGEPRELRILRATVTNSQLPDSISRLTKLEELNLVAVDPESLCSGIGACRRLQSLLIHTDLDFTLPPALTQLQRLSFMYLRTTETIIPRGWHRLTSMRALELHICLTREDGQDAILHLPGLQRLQTSSLPEDVSMLTSIQDLVFNFSMGALPPESMWALTSLRALSLEDLHTLETIPESVRGLANLEELGIVLCQWFDALPDCLGELPKLKKLALEKLPRLRYFPPTMGFWPSLQSVRLRDLPLLEGSREVLSELRQKVGEGMETYNVAETDAVEHELL